MGGMSRGVQLPVGREEREGGMDAEIQLSLEEEEVDC